MTLLEQPIPTTWRARTRNALIRAGIHTLGDLTMTSAETLLKAQGLGMGGMKYVRERLSEHGLDLCSKPLLAAQMDGVVVASLAKPVTSLDFYPGVYFIGINDLLKIGHTSCLWKRIAFIQTSTPYQITVEGFIPCGVFAARRIEKELHQRFQSLRSRGEWFRYEAELREYVAALPKSEAA